MHPSPRPDWSPCTYPNRPTNLDVLEGELLELERDLVDVVLDLEAVRGLVAVGVVAVPAIDVVKRSGSDYFTSDL